MWDVVGKWIQVDFGARRVFSLLHYTSRGHQPRKHATALAIDMWVCACYTEMRINHWRSTGGLITIWNELYELGLAHAHFITLMYYQGARLKDRGWWWQTKRDREEKERGGAALHAMTDWWTNLFFSVLRRIKTLLRSWGSEKKSKNKPLLKQHCAQTASEPLDLDYGNGTECFSKSGQRWMRERLSPGQQKKLFICSSEFNLAS